jgi:hypothetical protein
MAQKVSKVGAVAPVEAPAISIGATKESVIEARLSIIGIISAGRSDQVTVEALHAFTNAVRVTHTTIDGCTITINRTTQS